MKKILCKIAEEFSTRPFGRDGKTGKDHGQKFLRKYLLPKLRENTESILILDFSEVEAPPGTSFIDEVFSNLILEEKMTKEEILNRIDFKENEYFDVKPMSIKRMDLAESKL